MAVNALTEAQLARALCSPDLAKDLIAKLNAASAGAAATGSAGAVQTSNGSAGFADSGIVASAGSITVGAWAGTAIPVAYGGTGSTTAAAARTALGLGTAATSASTAFQASNATLTAIAAGGAPISVTGSKGSGAALISLLAAMVALGLITDSTSA